MAAPFILLTVCLLGSLLHTSQSTPSNFSSPDSPPAAVPSDSFNSRHAQAVGYEAEDVADDTAEYCMNIKYAANKTYIEADDARQEFALSDDVSEDEASDYYFYAMREAMSVMDLADECVMVMKESLEMENSLVDMSESLAIMVDDPEMNRTETRMARDAIMEVIDSYQMQITKWSFTFIEHAENIIAALRDAQQEIMEEPGASADALDDAKDSKNKIKYFMDNIMEKAEDMRHDADESYKDMNEDLDDLSMSLGLKME